MAESQVTRQRGVRRAWRVLGWVVLAEMLVIGLLFGRQLGEATRTQAAIDRVATRLQLEVQADCAFKRDVAGLAGTSSTRGAALVQLSRDARAAYVAKGCEQAIDPATRQPYGPPPPVPAPVPTR